ncbi:MAG: trypsin-like serine protease [Myxococcota bacterium]|jgi:V8-like Glu-specific endopeptidase|nr:trypsin-like serine protease [Myxococcota bacterium]
MHTSTFLKTPRALLSVAFFTGFLASCEDLDLEDGRAISSNPGEIVNGTTTNYKSWKGVVALFYSSGGYAGSICTATLIDPKVLLTAGHCVYLPGEGVDAVNTPSRISVLGGANINTFSRVEYPGPAKIVKHPSWTGNINNSSAVDLALIKLSSPITTVETYGVRVAPSAQVGDMGKIVGYGLSSSSAQDSAGVHRVGDTSILALGNRIMELGNPSGTCQGDSGGPFFTQQGGKWVVTGVTSFGISNTCKATGDAYDMNVLTYRQWIDTTMEDLVGHGLGETGSTDPVDTDTGSASGSDPCSGDVKWDCNPVNNAGCSGAGNACDYGQDQSGAEGFYCFPESTVALGKSCNPQNGPWCAPLGTCISGVCRKYCCSNGSCGSGMACEKPSPYWSQVSPQTLGVCFPDTHTSGEGEGEGEGSGEGEGEGSGEGEGQGSGEGEGQGSGEGEGQGGGEGEGQGGGEGEGEGGEDGGDEGVRLDDDGTTESCSCSAVGSGASHGLLSVLRALF